jgi:predicted transcriptional regulator
MSADAKTQTNINVRVDDELVRQMDALMERQGCTRTWLVRRALRKFLMDPDIAVSDDRAEECKTHAVA